ncbi:MAG: hypothetical protein KDC44_10330 [Phaeodactylibacter sp.]|nr:hypothetical protein [Phaeodactylibacter sp.]
MKRVTQISALIFALLLLSIAFMAVTRSWGILFFLTMLVPVLVVFQVWFVLRAKDSQSDATQADGWYEHR